jgi:hypothetical protein
MARRHFTVQHITVMKQLLPFFWIEVPILITVTKMGRAQHYSLPVLDGRQS